VVPASGIKDAEELAGWEQRFVDLVEFWAVTPNFLADKLNVVLKAMENNLRRNVKYRYFVDSFADACRWQQLVRTLRERLGYTDEKMGRLMKAVILWRDPNALSNTSTFSQNEYFVAITASGKKDGFCLKRLRDGEVYEGEQMSHTEVEEVVKSLKPLTEPGWITGYMQVPMQPQDIHGAYVVRIRFGETIRDEAVIRDREFKIGELVSKHSGEFASAIGGDYLCVFTRPAVALAFATNLQSIQGVQKIAIDVGPIIRELRVGGFDITGRAANNCASLLDQAGEGTIYMTQTFIDFMNGNNPT